MRWVSLAVAVLFAYTGEQAIAPARAAADDKSEHEQGRDGDAEGDAESTPQPSTGKTLRMPRTATAALVRAAAAYEYGDLNQVVDASRLITEGSLAATDEQRVEGLRWLGIGLYLTNRPLGAEAAFTELLHKDPRARLDPTTTRPELVAFFENIRHQQLARQRSARKLSWNFLPPAGQFQNGDTIKGGLVLGAEIATGALAATSYILYKSWQRNPGGTSTHPDAAKVMYVTNPVADAALVAVYIYGVIDGLVGYRRPIEDGQRSGREDDHLPISLQVFPGGGGLGFRF